MMKLYEASVSEKWYQDVQTSKSGGVGMAAHCSCRPVLRCWIFGPQNREICFCSNLTSFLKKGERNHRPRIPRTNFLWSLLSCDHQAFFYRLLACSLELECPMDHIHSPTTDLQMDHLCWGVAISYSGLGPQKLLLCSRPKSKVGCCDWTESRCRGCRGCRGCRLEIIGKLTGKLRTQLLENYWKTQVSPSKDGVSHNLHSHRRGGVLWFCLTEMFCETFGWKPDFASMQHLAYRDASRQTYCHVSQMNLLPVVPRS